MWITPKVSSAHFGSPCESHPYRPRCEASKAQRLAIGTFTGASALARSAGEPPSVLRARVTSKGGTTYAALQSMEAADVKALFRTAIRAAERRAGELADEFGRG
jgi:pyrroline-5-carboxylate reductase